MCHNQISLRIQEIKNYKDSIENWLRILKENKDKFDEWQLAFCYTQINQNTLRIDALMFELKTHLECEFFKNINVFNCDLNTLLDIEKLYIEYLKAETRCKQIKLIKNF